MWLVTLVQKSDLINPVVANLTMGRSVMRNLLHSRRTLALAEELGDAAVEAQACYSLGNTYTLLREYRAAEQYHSRHLAAARKLKDRYAPNYHNPEIATQMTV